jgi:hypothetical protein
MNTISKVLAFTVTICGAILGLSVSEYGFNGAWWSYFITIPGGMFFYGLIDRLVVMADARKNKHFIKMSRYVTAIVLCIFNGFLIHDAFFAPDLAAEIAKDVVLKQAEIQMEADSAKHILLLRKDEIYNEIAAEGDELKQRNDQVVFEAEGVSPSGQIGMGPVYAAKKEAFSRDSMEFARVNALMMAEAAKVDSAIVALDKEAAEKKANAHHQVSTGFNHRIELLHEVITRKPLNMFIAAIFFILCMILELLPLLAKYYLNIDEYFEHAAANVEAYLANRDLHKQHTTAEERHKSTLVHKYRIQGITNRYALASLRQKALHSENIIALTGEHFSVLVHHEETLSVSYPDQFDEHIKPVFDNAYKEFGFSHPKAFKTESLTTPVNV